MIYYLLHLHHRPVNDLSTAVNSCKIDQSATPFFGADGGFVYYKRVRSPSFLVWSKSVNVT